ncbi:hypothetical protein C7M56_10510 [Clostridium botulinum]|uniref:Uncharacterized protein n=2 Tax=Clostridium botulinum TaxID=1491 RepID=A0ABC8CY05_CLOBO|nr:hypothetical protein C7M56_10510 [Clostridium botulinum]
MITNSFEDLAQSLRVFGESYMRAYLFNLIETDRAEAVGNMEVAFNSVINAYHNLYDVMAKLLNKPVDWYNTPELCTILAIRNARHHNVANRIRSIFNYHLQNSILPNDIMEYVIVDFPNYQNGKYGEGDCFNFHISWFDLDELLNLPQNESRLRNTTKALIREYLNADEFEKYATLKGITKDRIFINVVPLILNAGIVIHPYIKNHVTPQSLEGKLFWGQFKDVHPFLTKIHQISIQRFNLPH